MYVLNLALKLKCLYKNLNILNVIMIFYFIKLNLKKQKITSLK